MQSKELFDKAQIETFYDKPFIKSFVKAVQKIDSQITPFYFPNTFQLVFLYKKIIIYKIILNKTNLEDISVDLHLKNILNTVIMLRSNIIPSKSVSLLQENVRKNFNKKRTGRILN